MDSVMISDSQRLSNFVGGLDVKRVGEVVNFRSGPCIVFGWFQSVTEGVDMWFVRQSSNDLRKYWIDYYYFVSRNIFIA
jgi:hypothetical protein